MVVRRESIDFKLKFESEYKRDILRLNTEAKTFTVQCEEPSHKIDKNSQNSLRIISLKIKIKRKFSN